MEPGDGTPTDFGIMALAFDVGGTLIDWHGTIRQGLSLFGKERGFERDWGEVTNFWTWSAIRALREQKPPAVANLDVFYRATLDDTLDKFGMVGVTDTEKSELAMAWHKLAAWPDAPAGHARLREKFIVAALTIQTMSLIIDVSRQAPFHWDCIIPCEMLGCYKPDPRTYRRAAELLVLRPDQILMVAAHNNDLLAAQAEGFRTAFIPRPSEQGDASTPAQEPNRVAEPDPSIDIKASDLLDLASRLGA